MARSRRSYSRAPRSNRSRTSRFRSSSRSATLNRVADMEAGQARAVLPLVRDPQPVRMASRKIYQFQRSLNAVTITNTTAPADTTGSFSFRLSDLPDYTEFTNLFDEYKFSRVEVSFVPTSPTNYSGPLYTVIDYDDAVVATIAQLSEYQTLQISGSGAMTKRTLVPKIAVAAYSGAFTSYAPQASWVDCSSPGVLWYGLKYGIVGLSGQPSTPQYVVSFRVTIQCRNVL